MTFETYYDQIATRVYTRKAWDGKWIEQRLIKPKRASKGHGQTFGTAEFTEDFGPVQAAGTPVYQANPQTVINQGLIGQYIKIVTLSREVQEDGQSIKWVEDTDLWHGFITEAEVSPDGATGGRATIRATYMAGLLDTLYCFRSVEQDVDTGAQQWTDTALGYNVLGTGDMQSVGSGGLIDANVHIRHYVGDTWTVKQALNNLLETNANPRVHGFEHETSVTWVLNDNSLLDWDCPPIETRGRTISDIFNILVNRARGLTWRADVQANEEVHIEILSVAPENVEVSGEIITAATSVDLDLDGNPWYQNVKFTVTPPRYDAIYVVGARPWRTITLNYETDASGALVGDSWSHGTTITERNGAYLRFKLSTAWDGLGYEQSDQGVRSPIENGIEGEGGTTLLGTREWVTGEPAYASELIGALPAPINTSTSLDGGTTTQPVMWAYNGGSWKTWNKPISVKNGYIQIGTTEADANQLKDYLDLNGGKFVITLGIAEPDPLTVAWVNNPSRWPRSTPRVLYINRPDFRYEALTAQTVRAVNFEGGSIIKTTNTSDDVSHSDVAAMQQTLAQAVASNAYTSGRVSYQHAGQISTANPPGTFHGNLTAAGQTSALNAVIDRVTWTFGLQGYGTKWETQNTTPGARGHG